MSMSDSEADQFLRSCSSVGRIEEKSCISATRDRILITLDIDKRQGNLGKGGESR